MRAVFKNMQPSPRYLRFCDFVLHIVLLISLAMKHFFQNRLHHEFSFFEPVVLMYINPINSKKCGTTFSQIFRFWFIDFSKKIFEIFFYPWGLPWGYVDQCKMLQVKKNNFWSRSCFLQTWNLFTWDTVQCPETRGSSFKIKAFLINIFQLL